MTDSMKSRARVLSTIKRNGKILCPKGKVVDIIGPGTKPNCVMVEYRKTKEVEISSKNLEFLYE